MVGITETVTMNIPEVLALQTCSSL